MTRRPEKLEQAKKIFDGLQDGTIDRSLFTDNANAYFSEQALQDFASGLGPLAHLKVHAGSTRIAWRNDVTSVPGAFREQTLRVWTYELPNGKLEQYRIAVQD